MAFTKLSDEAESVKILYYGDYGSGKTSALASAARLGPVLYVDAESGLKARPLRNLGIPVEKIEVHRADISWKALDELFWLLKNQIDKGKAPYKALLLDSVSEIQNKLVEQIMARNQEKAERKGMERDPFLTTLEDWGQNAAQLRDLIRKYRDLPIHVGFASLERRDQDDDGKVRYGPAVSPSVAKDLGGYVDIVCHTTVELIGEQEFYIGTFSQAGKYSAKDRFGVLPKRMVDPTFDRIIAYVSGELTRETDAIQQEANDRAKKARKASAA